MEKRDMINRRKAPFGRAGRFLLGMLFLLFAMSFPASNAAQPAKAEARQIIAASGVKGGLVAHIGCDEGELTAALRASDSFVVHGLDRDEEDVKAARSHIQSFGLYGPVSVELWRSEGLPYADNLVNLLVVENQAEIGEREILRVLAPRGVACIRESDGWTRKVKPWPQEIGEWTHFLHGPDGNSVVQDSRIGVPRRVRWSAGPRWATHHNRVPNVSSMVSADGRVFYILNEELPGAMDLPGQWYLYCRDAFNGVVLWKRPLENWGWQSWADSPVTTYHNIGGRFNQPNYLARTLVASQDRLFVTLGFDAPVTALDAASGEVVRVYEGTRGADEILHKNGKLIVAVHTRGLEERKRTARESLRSGNGASYGKKRLVALEAETGEVLWRSKEYVGINANRKLLAVHRHLNPVVGSDRVFAVTQDSLVALDWHTGEEVWKAQRPAAKEHKTRYDLNANDMVTLVHHNGVLLFAQLEPEKRLGWQETKGSISCFSASDGKRIWSRPCASWGWGTEPDLFVADGLAWVWGRGSSPLLGLNPRTGEVVRKKADFKTFDINHHHRCYRNKATSRYMLTSWRGAAMIPWDKGDASYNHWWFRAACRHGFLLANGLIYNSPNPCTCYVDAKLGGFNALAPEPSDNGNERRVTNTERLVKGPAYSAVHAKTESGSVSDWPTYRHDAYRSGTTSGEVPAELETGWKTNLNERPTPPVVGNEKVFVAIPERFSVVALEARHGGKVWQFRAGGRVDGPPSYHRGLILFGSADGYVYCVRASDGKLAWRFLAAPRRRRVMTDGRLESAWPVHGSVLVESGKVYVVAGRSSFLDGGFRTWVLDVRSGEMVAEDTICDEDKELGKVRVTAQSGPGMSSDVLVSDGDSVCMKEQPIFRNVLEDKEERPLLSPASGFLDTTWFNRASQWSLGKTLHGECLVADEDSAFSFKAYDGIRRNKDRSFFTPGRGSYELYSAPVHRKGKKGVGDKNARWKRGIDIAVTSIIKAGPTLFVAGSPDEVPEDDPWKHLECRGHGVLQAASSENGKMLSEYRLSSPPVTDGLAAADGRLFISTHSGQVVCLRSQGN